MNKVFNTGCFDSRHMDIGYGEGISQEEDCGILDERPDLISSEELI